MDDGYSFPTVGGKMHHRTKLGTIFAVIFGLLFIVCLIAVIIYSKKDNCSTDNKCRDQKKGFTVAMILSIIAFIVSGWFAWEYTHNYYD